MEWRKVSKQSWGMNWLSLLIWVGSIPVPAWFPLVLFLDLEIMPWFAIRKNLNMFIRNGYWLKCLFVICLKGFSSLTCYCNSFVFLKEYTWSWAFVLMYLLQFLCIWHFCTCMVASCGIFNWLENWIVFSLRQYL